MELENEFYTNDGIEVARKGQEETFPIHLFIGSELSIPYMLKVVVLMLGEP